MSSDFSPEIRQELLDDFYAECDELFTAARGSLGEIEGGAAGGAEPEARLQAVFRNVHSLKGLAAIVGLRDAETLAHAMEDLLRGLTKRDLALTPAVVEALLSALQRLEQVVATRRQGGHAPAIDGEVAALRRLGQAAPAPSRAPETAAVPSPPRDPADAARARGLQPWRGTFSPSPRLDQRGINVGSVRARLGEIGEILAAAPIVRGHGGIVFEFTLGLRGPPAETEAWERDGVTFEAVAGKQAAAPAETLALQPSHVVRVDLSRLDNLLRIAGEMVIHRSRLDDRIRHHGDPGGLREITLTLGRSVRELHEAISSIRMVPIAEIFSSMPVVVRQMTRESPKKAAVRLEGQQTLIDKFLVERLKEPLLHLVRNSFAHGVEPPEERVAAGKPPEATILLQATSAGESVIIRVRDDGRGVDAPAVVARARSLGLTVPDNLGPDALLRILCTPGFSTRSDSDLAAGRGVGMAVVANAVRELGGTIALDTAAGVRTEFALRLPLTLSIVKAIIATAGSETCAVPQGSIEEIVQVPAGEVRSIRRSEVIPYRGGLLPFLRLRSLFGLPPAEGKALTMLVVKTERGAAGLLVDRVTAQREIVVRPLVDVLVKVPGISGATELGDGRPILILDPIAITGGVVRPSPAELAAAAPREPAHSSS